EVRQQYNTGEMIYTFPEILGHLSRDFTFLPGDVVSGGTGAGTALDSSKRGEDGKLPPDRFVEPGDVLEVTSPAIGTLRNRVTAPAGAVAVQRATRGGPLCQAPGRGAAPGSGPPAPQSRGGH